jgi:hypothetical protein
MSSGSIEESKLQQMPKQSTTKRAAAQQMSTRKLSASQSNCTHHRNGDPQNKEEETSMPIDNSCIIHFTGPHL